MKAILPKCVMFVKNFMKCRYESEIWNVIVEITLTEIKTVLSTLCIISYHRMLCGQACSFSLQIFDKQVFR